MNPMNASSHSASGRSRRDGSSLIAVVIAMTVLAAFSLAMVSTYTASTKAHRELRERVSALYVAEAGLAEAMFQVERGLPGDVGSPEQPVAYGNGTYHVQQTDQGAGVFALVATGEEDHAGARIELVMRTVLNSIWQWAAFGDEGLTVTSNARVDSYDSGLGTYASQATNGSGSSVYADEDSDIGSNGDVSLEQNSEVHGSATSGPAGTVTVIGNAEISGTTSSAPSEMELPPLDIPELPDLGALDVPNNATVSLSPGSYNYSNLLVGTGALLEVEGPATLVFGTFQLSQNSSFRVDGTNGPVEVYVIDDFIQSSNTLIASETFTPSHLRFNLASDNVNDPEIDVDFNPDNIDFDSNAKLYGTIYAPNARVEINSNFELFGAIVARSLLLDSNSLIHYDEALLQSDEDSVPSWETVCWRLLPYSPQAGGN